MESEDAIIYDTLSIFSKLADDFTDRSFLRAHLLRSGGSFELNTQSEFG
jgi:hypothetical protein